jgi:hypothetical protein
MRLAHIILIGLMITRRDNPLWYCVAILLYAGVVGFLLFKLPPLIAATGH